MKVMAMVIPIQSFRSPRIIIIINSSSLKNKTCYLHDHSYHGHLLITITIYSYHGQERRRVVLLGFNNWSSTCRPFGGHLLWVFMGESMTGSDGSVSKIRSGLLLGCLRCKMLLLMGGQHLTNDLGDKKDVKLSPISCRLWRKLTAQASKRSTADGPPFQHVAA